MNRELKFRAWDKSDKEKGPYMLGPYYLTDSIFNYKDIRSLPLMQFTGLLDMNGKEIYEGDICSMFGRLNVVEYNVDYGFFGMFQEGLLSEQIEVVGNIYENIDY
jgi:hypothetical protein